MEYVVIKKFTDKYNKEKYNIGDILNLTKKRAKEILEVGELIKPYEEELPEEK